MTQMVDYGMRTHLDVPYETAVERITVALKAEGFGVLTTIDVKATMKQKLDVEFKRYVILGACNPPLAYRALTTEAEVGLLLPCNVIVYDAEEGGTVVSIVDPIVMLSAGLNPALNSVAEEAAARLRRVLAALDAA